MTAEQKALELYPVKYMDEKRGERKHPDLNKPLREAFMRGVEYTLDAAIVWLKENADKYIVDMEVSRYKPSQLHVGGMCWEHLKDAIKK